MIKFVNPEEVKKQLIVHQLADDKSLRVINIETTNGIKPFICIGKYLFEKQIFIALCIIYSQAEENGIHRFYSDTKMFDQLSQLSNIILSSWEELGFTMPETKSIFSFGKTEKPVNKFFKFVFQTLFKNVDIEKSIFQYSDQNLAVAMLHQIEEIHSIT